MRNLLFFSLLIILSANLFAQKIDATFAEDFTEKFPQADMKFKEFISFEGCLDNEALSETDVTARWKTASQNTADIEVYPIGMVAVEVPSQQIHRVAFVAVETNKFKDNENQRAQIEVVAKVGIKKNNGEINFLATVVCYHFEIWHPEKIEDALKNLYLSKEANGLGEVAWGVGTVVPEVGMYRTIFAYNTDNQKLKNEPAIFETIFED